MNGSEKPINDGSSKNAGSMVPEQPKASSEIPPKLTTENRVIQSEDGERMRKLRDILDRTVDKLVAKLEQNHFINNMPKGLNSEYLANLQSRLASVIRRDISKEIELALEEQDYASKLNSLDALVRETQQSSNHQAWRPPLGSTPDATVAGCTVAHDLEVSLAHKEKLAALLKKAEDECEDLTQQVLEAEQRLRTNQAVLANLETSYSNVNNVIQQNIKILSE